MRPACSVRTPSARSSSRSNAVISSKVKNRSLLAADFKAGQLPTRGQGRSWRTRAHPAHLAQQGAAGPIPGDLPRGSTFAGAYAGTLDGGASTTASSARLDRRSGVCRFDRWLSPGRLRLSARFDPGSRCPASLAVPVRPRHGDLCVYEGCHPTRPALDRDSVERGRERADRPAARR